MADTAETVGLRRLLRRLRDIMKGGGGAQERLDRIVESIAQEMVAEVCSAYVLRAGEVLELFATQGLKREAVHRTRLRVGEGLVGEVALHGRALALADAQSHPAFAYRPETGEEIYHSLMGVPIQRGGRVLGVLVVQNRTRRQYTEDEVEALETIAMVLAELVAGGELIPADEARRGESQALLPARLTGVMLNGGFAMGAAVLHRPERPITKVVSEDPAEELKRLEAALSSMRAALDQLLSSTEAAAAGETRDILETYRMFAEDRGWLAKIRETVSLGLTSEAAVKRVQNETRARMSQISDPYLRERLADLDDLSNRLIAHLIQEEGQDGPTANGLPEHAVLVARTMGPAELLDYDTERLRALVMEEGTQHSHVAIVARALDIPVVGRVGGLLASVDSGDLVMVDGDHGQVLLRPRDDARKVFAESIKAMARQKAAYAAIRDLPSVTRDGLPIALSLNAGLLLDLPQLEATGAEGIGLYRTEIPFMVRNAFPDVAAQTELYQRILDQADGRPVIFRTLDVGGDKALPYWRGESEENPALGWRAVRIGLDRPALLRQQVRALIRASAGRPLSIMFPMIAEVAELEAARAIVQKEIDRERRLDYRLPERVEIGVMVEVPALLWQLPQLMKRVDFLSIGSNDLAQFLFASDRGNPRVSRRYDLLSPPFLSAVAYLAREADAAGVPLTVCGEMAGRPIEAMALVGVGVRRLSMAPPSVGPVKSMVRAVNADDLSEYLQEQLRSADHSLREGLRTYARDHEIPL